jgi:hypothetical protein
VPDVPRLLPGIRGSRVRPAGDDVAEPDRAGTGRPGPALGLGLGLVLGLLALGPGLARGFLLSYDMVLVPREPFSAAMVGLNGGPPRAVPSDAVLAAASRVLPADIVQKLVLLSIFVLACVGAAVLLRGEHWLARLAAGAYYAWNPFVAERLIIGQWALLLGYAGLPWVLRAALREPGWGSGGALGGGAPAGGGRSAAARRAALPWRWAGWLALAMLPAAVGGFAAVLVTALVLVPAVLLGQRAVRPALAAAGVLLLASLPWLVPSLRHALSADPAGISAFAARADTPFGSLGSLLMLGGMWNAQAVPAGYGGAWSVLWLAAALTALAGYVTLAGPGAGWRAVWRAGARPRWPGLGVAAVVGLVIASIGITGPGRDLLRAATGLWPGFSVLRDGQQFAAPLALAEAVGFGLAVGWAIRPRAARDARVARDTAAAVPGRPDPLGVAIGIAAILLPVLLLPGLAWGAAGRLRPVWYPASWLTAARLINESPVRGGALVLPWTAYRRVGWNHGETLLDPWPRLLGRAVIWNDGGQIGRIQLAPDDPRARRLDAAITGSGPLTSTFATAGVRFVIVDTRLAANAAGRRLPGCRLLLTGPGLAVYQVPAR